MSLIDQKSLLNRSVYNFIIPIHSGYFFQIMVYVPGFLSNFQRGSTSFCMYSHWPINRGGANRVGEKYGSKIEPVPNYVSWCTLVKEKKIFEKISKSSVPQGGSNFRFLNFFWKFQNCPISVFLFLIWYKIKFYETL